MKAKANLFRTLLVLPVVVLVAMAVALFGMGLRTAETQTSPSSYKVQAVYSDTFEQTHTIAPYDINDSGHVAGTWSWYNEMGSTVAFLYKDGGMIDLGTFPFGYPWGYSYANAINNSDQVVGSDGGGAFLYDSTNGMKDLGTLGGSTPYAYGTTTSAYDINDSGQVVGSSYTASGQSHAFLYENGVMKDLGTLGGTSSWASDINDSGQIVGGSLNSSGQSHAFLYQNEKMTDLGDRWFPDGDCIGWNLNSGTYKINNEGQILVEALRQDGYIYRYGALILTPTSDVPPPADCQAPSAPTITSPQNNTYDTDGSFSVSGSAETASTVELFEGATSKGTTKADSSSTGAWSIALSEVSEGAHTYSAKATDAAGNTSSASDSVTVTVDKTAPKVSTLSATSVTSTGVPLRKTDFKATFSEKMDPDSLRDPVTQVSTTFKLFKCSSTTSTNCTTQITEAPVTPSADGLSATLNPFGSKSTVLQAKTRYKVVVTTGAKDVAGNALDQDSSTTGNQQKVGYFTTGSS